MDKIPVYFIAKSKLYVYFSVCYGTHDTVVFQYVICFIPNCVLASNP